MSTSESRSTATRWPLVVGIAAVAFNLRPALASVGPLVEDIRASTGLSSAALGTLTTIPLLAFGCLSLLASPVARRVGLERAVAIGLGLIAAGTALRATESVALLFAGTALLGVGVALGNVLLPALAKRSFSDRPGPITSLYSSMMGVGAAIAAGVSVPIASAVGWRTALGGWAIPAVIALVIWLPRLRGEGSVRTRAGGVPVSRLATSWTAWQVALYMGLQSMSFYVLLAWLPAILQARGVSEASAGGLLALSQVTGIVGSAIVPAWAGSVDDQRPIVWVLGGLEVAGLAGLFWAGSALWAGVWVSLLGAVLGGTFALALTLLVVRSPDADTAGSLSGMAQSIGYLLAALAPPFFGWLFDVTGAWSWTLVGLGVVLVGKMVAGVPAARPHVLGAENNPAT